MRCARCAHENFPESDFCVGCGARLGLACSSCGTELPPGSRFCNKCGTGVRVDDATELRFTSPHSYTPKHLAEKILTSKSVLEGERKQVTVLFCDLADSTALAERLGPEAMHSLLNRFFELSLRQVHSYEGTINQFLGDGFMALFGAPVTHEDHVRRAALAAVGIQRALREQSGEFGLPDQVELRVRMGLNTGPVVVGKIGDNLRMDYTAIGDSTNLAARLQQLAAPGEIYVSEATHRLVVPYVECEALGQRTIKGKSDPVAIYRLRGVRTSPKSERAQVQQVGSPLVGRDSEVAELVVCIDRLRGGRGAIVGVLGQAGLGKSRLVTEVRGAVSDRDLLWLEGRALSFGQSLSYWPFLEVLRGWASITEADRDVDGQEKLSKKVLSLFPDDHAEVLPYLATLLGLPVPPELESRVKYLDGQAMGRRIFLSVRRLFERLAQERPVVVVFEDLHWSDQSSTELIEHLFPLVETLPLMLCGVGRPDPASSAARLAELARTRYAARYTEIELSPLAPGASAALVGNLIGGTSVPGSLQNLILRRTEGNPFFAEEVVRSLAATGVLAWDEAAAHWRATGDVETITIPDTVQGVIMARVDRLDDSVKQVLKLASVIGRSFFYRVLEAIADAERELDRQLEALQSFELIREKQQVPELEYIFKHVLVQEATYESILLERRRDLHRRVAECTEALFANRLEEFYGLLAYHYAKAEEWLKAQDYLFKAGDHAGRLAADTEALEHYRNALDAYGRVFGNHWDPLQRAALERKMGEALMRRGLHAEAREYLEHAIARLGVRVPAGQAGARTAIVRELLRQILHRYLPRRVWDRRQEPADPVVGERARIMAPLGWIYYFLDQERFLLSAIQGLNSSEEAADPGGIAFAAMAIGMICDGLPLHAVAQRYHHQAVRCAEQIQDPVALGLTYMGLAHHKYAVGHWESALEAFARSIESYRNAGDVRGLGGSSGFLFHVLLRKGDLAAAEDIALECVRLGQDAGDPLVWGWGLEALAIWQREIGSLDEAVTSLQQALELFRSVPDYLSIAETTAELGRCYLRQEKLNEAVAAFEGSRSLVIQRRLKGHPITAILGGFAEGCLQVAEATGGRERSRALRKARHACRLSLRQARAFSEALTPALRSRGTYEWLRGRAGAARHAWEQSLASANALGARWELAGTLLEMGKRTGDRGNLTSAAVIFTEIGAHAGLSEARRLLESATP